MDLFNHEMESEILGSCMERPDLIDEVSANVNDVDFHLEKHRLIFGRMVGLSAAGRLVDPIAMVDGFRVDDLLDAAGGPAYLMTLSKRAIMYGDAKRHARTIAEYARKRRTVRAMLDGADAIREDGSDPRMEAEKALAVSAPIDNEGDESTSDLIARVHQRFEDRYDSKRPDTIEMPWKELTDLTPIWWGQLVIVAARPGIGKTSFMSQIIDKSCSGGIHVDGYSCEMSNIDILSKIVTQRARVPSREIKRWDDDQWRRVARIEEEIHNWPLQLYDRGGWTVEEIHSAAKIRHRQIGRHIIVIDYFQLLSWSLKQPEIVNLTHMSKVLKQIARGLGCIVILLSQLNRDLERRPNKRPLIADLRSCGSLEQDADTVVMLYRDAPYELIRKQEANPGEYKTESDLDGEVIHHSEVLVRKARWGEVGSFNAHWAPRWQAFENLSRVHE